MQESETIGARIRQARTKAGLSQPELSAKSNVPQTTISGMENGTAGSTFSALRALCAALDVSADWVVGLSASPRPLEPQSWVVDLDVVDRLRKAESGEAVQFSDSERRWAFAIPNRYAIMPSTEFQRLREEIETAWRAPRKKRR